MHMHIQNLVVCKTNLKKTMENPVLVLVPFWTNILTPPLSLSLGGVLCLIFFFFLLFQNFVADKNK